MGNVPEPSCTYSFGYKLSSWLAAISSPSNSEFLISWNYIKINLNRSTYHIQVVWISFVIWTSKGLKLLKFRIPKRLIKVQLDYPRNYKLENLSNHFWHYEYFKRIEFEKFNHTLYILINSNIDQLFTRRAFELLQKQRIKWNLNPQPFVR